MAKFRDDRQKLGNERKKDREINTKEESKDRHKYAIEGKIKESKIQKKEKIRDT